MGPPLFEALIANAVFLCDADALLHWNSAAEEGAWGGLKTGPPRRHQIQPVEGPVLDPRAKETYLKRGQKVDPLEIKSGPPWRVQLRHEPRKKHPSETHQKTKQKAEKSGSTWCNVLTSPTCG